MPKEVFVVKAITTKVDLTALECPACGVVYALDEEYRQRRLKDGATWYCPNGHGLSYTDSEVDRWRKRAEQLEEDKKRLDRILTSERQVFDQVAAENTDLKKEAKRIARRIHAGVCPHCNRTFQNLARHMGTKHAVVG